MKSLQRSGFTFVELIIVVVILGILGTIGFVSYSGYLGGVRDGNRIAQIKDIQKTLQVYSTNKPLPLPDDSVEITASGATVGYQGYAGKNILQQIHYTNGGVDPQDNTYFTYMISKNKKQFQVLTFLEESDNLTKEPTTYLPGITQTYAADYSERFPKSLGAQLGVILQDTTNTPIQDIESGSVDIVTSGDDYQVVFDDTISLTGSGSQLEPLANTSKTGGLGFSCKSLLDRKSSLKGNNGVYMMEIDGNVFEVYCDMETDGGGWTHIGSKINGGNNTRGDFGVLATKPGVAANVTISQNSFRNNLTEGMACSTENCWTWELDAGFKTCLENGCTSQLGNNIVSKIFGSTGVSQFTANRFRYAYSTTTTYMFDVHNVDSSQGVGARTNRRNMDGSGAGGWQEGDQWDIYVR